MDDRTFNDLPWTNMERDLGHRCPTCSSFVKTYHRRLSTSIARGLVRLYGLSRASPETEFFHVKSFGFEAKEIALLAHWGLMHEAQNDDTAKRTSGYWKITQAGIDFVELRLLVPLYVVIHINSVLGFTGDAVSIRDCLERRNRFNYAELMSVIAAPEGGDPSVTAF